MPRFHALRTLAAAFLVAVLCLMTPGLSRAQDQSEGFLFSPNGFGITVPGLAPVEEKTVSPEAVVATVPENAGDDFTQDGAAPVGFLRVVTTVKSGWHIYSGTQGDGGMPTRFTDLKCSDEDFSVGDFMLASEITLAKDASGSVLEELFGKVEWIAPIYSKSGKSLEGLKITGVVDALACSEGEGGTCFPQQEVFSASHKSDADVSETLATALKYRAETESMEAAEETPGSEAGAGQDQSAEVTTFASKNFVVLLLIAFFGGLILNATPCVLPVVGLKILSFFEQAGKSRSSAFVLNCWYALGVLLVFGALAFASVGLSFLFTRALFQIIMSAIVFAMALSLIGVWELETPAFLGGEKSNELSSKEGGFGAVFKGVVTTLLAIPCGAPLLSPALDWASETTRQGHAGLVFVVYLVIGLGMASPFLVAGAFPELLKFFPKPGQWMETFRKTMGFFLLIAVVWIIYSAPVEYQLPTTAFLFALWFACWNIGRNQYEIESGKKKLVGWIVSLAVVLIVGLFSFNIPGSPIKTTLQRASEGKMTRWAVRAHREGKLTQEHWSLFDRETLDAALAKGQVVAVDFTADWCMNCKFLERTILHTEDTLEEFDARNILTLTADWTNLDAQTPDVLAINELLDAHGARQVPTLMIFSPENPDAPVVLRGLYTKSALMEALDRVAPRP